MKSIITNQRKKSSQPKTKPTFLLYGYITHSSIINVLFTPVRNQYVTHMSCHIYVNLVGRTLEVSHRRHICSC